MNNKTSDTKLAHPKISIDGIYIKDLEFASIKDIHEPIEIEAKFEVENKFSEDKNKLTHILTLKLFDKHQSPPFKLKISVIGFFSKENKEGRSLEEFSKYNAPTILFPYLRQYATMVTRNSQHDTFYIPPINIFQLIDDDKS
jgi:preprotein translocase subunit SecB